MPRWWRQKLNPVVLGLGYSRREIGTGVEHAKAAIREPASGRVEMEKRGHNDGGAGPRPVRQAAPSLDHRFRRGGAGS